MPHDQKSKRNINSRIQGSSPSYDSAQKSDESDEESEEGKNLPKQSIIKAWRDSTIIDGSKLDMLQAAVGSDKLSKFILDITRADATFKNQEFAQALIDELVAATENNEDHLMLIYKAILGKHIRDMNSGEYFGERALDGNTVRTASVTTLEDCHFVTLTAEEYNTFVKMKHRLLREAKHALLTEKFPGYSFLPTEELWKFQYLFQVIFV